MVRVYTGATIGDTSATASTHRCCAERNFLDKMMAQARRDGVRKENVVAWVKRKVHHVAVFRFLKNGQLATSCPCYMCRDALIRFDLFVTYVDENNQLVQRVRASELPVGIYTSSQKAGRHIH
jgi:cytidine deaminase